MGRSQHQESELWVPRRLSIATSLLIFSVLLGKYIFINNILVDICAGLSAKHWPTVRNKMDMVPSFTELKVIQRLRLPLRMP